MLPWDNLLSSQRLAWCLGWEPDSSPLLLNYLISDRLWASSGGFAVSGVASAAAGADGCSPVTVEVRTRWRGSRLRTAQMLATAVAATAKVSHSPTTIKPTSPSAAIPSSNTATRVQPQPAPRLTRQMILVCLVVMSPLVDPLALQVRCARPSAAILSPFASAAPYGKRVSRTPAHRLSW